jgi:hypothetical protein
LLWIQVFLVDGYRLGHFATFAVLYAAFNGKMEYAHLRVGENLHKLEPSGDINILCASVSCSLLLLVKKRAKKRREEIALLPCDSN